MSAKKRLRRAFIATGLTLFSLAPSFNAIAAPLPADDRKAVKRTAPRLINVKAGVAMLDVFKEIQAIVTDKSKDPAYIPAHDPALQEAANKLKLLIASGANPNLFEGTGIDLFRAKGMTAFQAAIVLAAEIQRPDLIEICLAHGADPLLKAPDQWSPMDYAVSSFIGAQSVSRMRINSSLLVIKVLDSAGVPLSSAGEMIKISQGKLKTYVDLARNLPGLVALRDYGLISAADFSLVMDGKPELLQTIRNTKSITPELLKSYGAKLIDYHEARPGGPEPYEVAADDTLDSIATRFANPMGAFSPEDAAHKIAALNNIPLTERGQPLTPLESGLKLLIPLPVDVEIIYVRPPYNSTLLDAAKHFKNMFYKQSLTSKEMAAEIAVLNGIDPATIEDKLSLNRLIMPLANDSHNQIAKLTRPGNAGNREVDLVVIEPADDHQRDTYRVATGTAYSINPNVDLSQFHALSEYLPDFPGPMSDALRMMLSGENSPVRDRVVFSHSMAIHIRGGEPQLDGIRDGRGPDHPNYESIRLLLERMDRAKPTIFTAAGNYWPKEGRYIQSFQPLHSPHAVIIGAAGQYPVGPGQKDRVMAPYSTYGADVCAPLPNYLTEQMEGTSFSTPLTAAVYRQMAEWYGDRLSFEEIMAAALMSADRDVLDYVDIADPKKIKSATFRTNGGGLPNHGRCGAGVINIERWKKALDKLVELKNPGMDAEGSTMTVLAGTPVIVPSKDRGGRAEYVYSVTVPSDMTLGKLTFLLPQHRGRHSEIVVRTPAGFEKHMPKTIFDVVSTFAFAYEDVKAGSVIEIRTTEPLAPSAGIMLRGHAPGNAIALLRQHLQAEKILPEALKTMKGEKVVGPLKPVTVLQNGKLEAAIEEDPVPAAKPETLPRHIRPIIPEGKISPPPP